MPSPPTAKVLFASATVLAFFAAAELALWLGGAQTLLEREDPFRGFSRLVRVFHREGDRFRTRQDESHTFNDQSFLAEKPAGGLRAFVLGGSSAFGFPWTANEAFSGILQDVLGEALPGRHVEVVNAAGISYGVHRLRIVADELLAYEPDVFIVYEGHNEFIEPAFYRALKERRVALDRANYLLARSRIYSLARRAIPEHTASDADAMFATRVERDQSAIFDHDEKREIVLEFRRTLAELVQAAGRRGVRVILATVPCNLSEWRPQRSIGAGLPGKERDAWARALAAGRRELAGHDYGSAAVELARARDLTPDHAETYFLLGQAEAGASRWDEARGDFARACDEDASPIRRISAINDAIREIAARHGATLVDMDRVFEQGSPHGLVGLNLIEDYAHPTRQGHALIAWHLLRALDVPADRGLFDRVVARRPSTGGGNPVWLFNQGYLLENQERPREAIAKYEEAIALRPDYVDALRNLSRLYAATGRHDEAERLAAALARLAPGDPGSRMVQADALARQGEVERAIEMYRRLAEDRPDSPRVLNGLGALLLAAGKTEEARAQLERAVALEPANVTTHRSLGGVYDRLGRLAEAAEHFRRALELDPGAPEAYYNLGVVLAKAGKAPEAVRQFELALEIDPGHAAARHNLDVLLERAP